MSDHRFAASDRPIVVTGAGGRLAPYFLRRWGDSSPEARPIIATGRTALPSGTPGLLLDLANRSAVRDFVAQTRPGVIVHCAALADVDQCERDRAAAYRDNVAATRNLVAAVAETAVGCRFVYISTDQVYCGPGPGRPGDERPLNFYSWSKLWGEDIALRLPEALVLRLNYVGRGTRHGMGLAGWLAENLQASREITLFDDVLFNPCHGSHVPRIVEDALALRLHGVLNAGSAGAGCSKADFLLDLAARLGLPTETVRIGQLAKAGLATPRPLDMRMDVTQTEAQLQRSLPDIQSTLASLAAEWRTPCGEGGDE